MALPHHALVLVADGTKVLFFATTATRTRSTCAPRRMTRARIARTATSRPTRRGRASRAWATAARPMEETDFHQQEEDRWVKDAADEVKKRALRNDFDALAIIAPPKALGVPQGVPPQRGREADRAHHQQGNDRPSNPRHRGIAGRRSGAARVIRLGVLLIYSTRPIGRDRLCQIGGFPPIIPSGTLLEV